MIHAIMATWAFDEAKKRAALSRNCPKCRHEQPASDEKINSMIACEKCGSEIPPKIAANIKAKKNKQNSK
jgi:ribosomal protein S27E